MATPDLSALCAEIRASDSLGNKFNARHHWCVQLPARYSACMQTISCSVCGNYQSVSTFDLQYSLMESASHIMCDNEAHFWITLQKLREEEAEDSGMETDSIPELLLDEDDELGAPPGQNPVLVHSYDGRSSNLNDLGNEEEQVYDWVLQADENEVHYYYPRQ